MEKELEPFTPFESILDLSGLIRYWKSNLKDNAAFQYFPVESLLKQIDDARELHGPIHDMSVVEKHHNLIGFLLSAIFPSATSDNLMMAAHRPFHPTGIFATEKYLEVLPFDRVRNDIRLVGKGSDIENGRLFAALFFILHKYYNTNASLDVPILLAAPDNTTGLERIYKVELDYRFVDVETKDEVPELDAGTIDLLLNHPYDIELWTKHLQPEKYVLRGFVLSNLVDVTDQETLSSIKYYLLKRDAVTCGVNFLTIQDKIRSLFRLPELQLGIVFFDPNNNIISNTGVSEWNSFMVNKDTIGELSCEYFKDSIYDKAYVTRKPVIVENLREYPNKTFIEKDLLKRDVANIIIAPLVNNEEVVGVLELVSNDPGSLNPMNAAKLVQVLPMFSAAIERVLGDLQNEVRALIQKECTAIHPSVEWKFLEAGYQVIGSSGQGARGSLPEIVFPEVYPIFGLSDIRNSSMHRSQAIRDDLIENLRSAASVLKAISAYKNMPILDELRFSIKNEIASIENGLASGAETSVISFLSNRVNPALKVFEAEDDPLKSVIRDYFSSLDPHLGVIYNQRKAYEESVTEINERISARIESEEKTAQEIVPHYFEKYKTDGVEYNAYLGQSLLQEKEFHPLYLSNFRLWQLLMMCDIAIDIENHKSNLAHPLDIAQLILVHSDPLAIRFRQDEKRFDVDGAYNIRYEIVKKRIDKAVILGTNERLTQPGKIAIVYSRNEDVQEYERYFNYLKSEGFIEDAIENLELEELQGAKGLRAMRITVNMSKEGSASLNKELLGEIMDELEKV